MGCGLWAVGCGLWAVGCGLWAVGSSRSIHTSLLSTVPLNNGKRESVGIFHGVARRVLDFFSLC